MADDLSPKGAPKTAAGRGGLLLQFDGSDAVVRIRPGETLLKASVRGGVPVPHLCLAGECGSCRCRLLEGQVRLKSDISHHVDAQALGRGYLLACQSEALTDVRLAVPGLSPRFEGQAVRRISGRIASASPLNHDIRRLVVEIDEPLAYRAGQFAQISVPGHDRLAEAPRCYSFAAAPGRASVVEFHVRRVPGGDFTEWLFADDRSGQAVTLTGPLGDFGFHEDGRPMVCVAGGSGLAPIKAMLEQLCARASAPDATLFLAARTQADLYCRDDIARLQKRWPGHGRLLVVPVLSQEPHGSGWDGLTGFCTEHIERFCIPAESSFYLCGPPTMIDSVLDMLKDAVSPEHVRYDRFLDRGTIAATDSQDGARGI